jgi:hypothetical protein
MRKLPRLPKGIPSSSIFSHPPMPTSRPTHWAFNHVQDKHRTAARAGVELPDGTIRWIAVGSGDDMAALLKGV